MRLLRISDVPVKATDRYPVFKLPAAPIIEETKVLH
jgi:hypothetical protein